MLHQFNAILAQVKTENDTMADEITWLSDSIFDIHHSLDHQLHDSFDIATEIHKDYQRSKNLLVFDIPDSIGETPEILNSVISELLTDIGFNNEFPKITLFGHYQGKKIVPFFWYLNCLIMSR